MYRTLEDAHGRPKFEQVRIFEKMAGFFISPVRGLTPCNAGGLDTLWYPLQRVVRRHPDRLGETMVSAENAKRLLALHGEVRPQPPADWTGAFPLPPAVERYYREVGPANITIEAHGNPYFLPCLADLWRFQAGYRWNGLTGEPIADWDDDWLVVADEGGDPFIFARSSGAVLHALHGQGEWDAGQMFPDLSTMAACLAQLGAIVLESRDEYMEEDCSIRPKFKALASDRLRELLGSKSDAQAVLDVLGWG